jgi:hypothetical protein
VAGQQGLRLDAATYQSGQALDARQGARLATGFSRSVSHLQVHTDARAAHLASALDAEALTVGSHIFFAADRSPQDFSLLAHETAHALRQPAGRPEGTVPVGAADSAEEGVADQAASALLAGRRAHAGAPTPAHVARKGRGLLGWAWDQVEDPGEFISDVVEHPLDATVGAAGGAFVEGVKQDASELSDMGSNFVGGMRDNATMIRKGGDAAEAWLVNKQKEGAAKMHADADAHADSPFMGPFSQANAWLADQTGQATTGILGGAITLGTGLLAASADPVDTGAGLLKVGSEVGSVADPVSYAASSGTKYAATGDTSSFNPFAKGTALGAVWKNVSKPYARAIDEGRPSEAGGRFIFDLASLLVGAEEANAASKTTRVVGTGAKVDALAKTVPAGVDLAATAPDLAATAPAATDLADTVRAGPALAEDAPAASNLADTGPGPGLADTLRRPMPTLVPPGTNWLSPRMLKQYLKMDEWLTDFSRPQKMTAVPTPPVPAGLGEIEAAAQARTPIVTHLSESFHQTIWESTGGTGKAPIAFRNKDVLFVDYEALPPAARDAVDAAKQARRPGSW